MIHTTTATAAAAATAPQPASASKATARGFLDALGAVRIATEAKPLVTIATEDKTAMAASMPSGSLSSLAALVAGSELHETLSPQIDEANRRHRDLMLEAFNLVGEATGCPISESVGFRRDGDHFKFYSMRQRAGGPEDNSQFPHPQGDALSAVFNGDDPKYAALTKKVKALLQQADAAFVEARDLERQVTEAMGGDFLERPLDGDYAFGIPNRFADEGQAKAASDPAAFAKFRQSLSADDLARLSDEQIYSRFFVRSASKDEMAAALDAEREKPARGVVMYG
jgi:hypothetical protein